MDLFYQNSPQTPQHSSVGQEGSGQPQNLSEAGSHQGSSATGSGNMSQQSTTAISPPRPRRKAASGASSSASGKGSSRLNFSFGQIIKQQRNIQEQQQLILKQQMDMLGHHNILALSPPPADSSAEFQSSLYDQQQNHRHTVQHLQQLLEINYEELEKAKQDRERYASFS